ncbi:MAG: vWA domain-containing protein [Armatimonadota bacterium]
MSFLSPLSLLLLIPLGGIIIILYLLKLKRREQTVSSIMLWQDAVADIQANAPFQKLKKNLLLLLQLIILFMMVTAIARPYMRSKGVSDNKIVVILDTSASMRAVDVKPSRFDDAKSRALDIVSKMGPGNTMLVMTAGTKAKVAASFTSDKRSLTETITRLQPADTGCNMRQAMLLALSLIAGKSTTPPRVVVLSDGGFETISDLSARDAKIDFMRIGKSCDNMAITGMASRKALSGEQQVFIGLKNFSKKEYRFNLEVYLNDNILDIREKTVPAGASRQEIIKDVDRLSGRITAKLDLIDDLEADNSASVYLSGAKKISVLLVSKGNVFLQNALNLDPRTQITRSDYMPSDFKDRSYDLVVFDRTAPPSDLPQGGYLLIGTSAYQGPASPGKTIPNPAIVDFPRNNPVNEYVDFGSVKIAGAMSLQPEPWATPILESDGGIIGVSGSHNGRNFVQLSWNLLESDFPLRVGFPIFVTNCLDWLVPSRNVGGGESVRTGQPIFIDVPPDTTEAQVTDPSGKKQTLKVTQIPAIFDNTDYAGVYKVQSGSYKKEFACNLTSSRESDTTPEETFVIGAQKFASSGRAVYTNRELYTILILVALAVLTFEWYAYHRRI